MPSNILVMAAKPFKRHACLPVDPENTYRIRRKPTQNLVYTAGLPVAKFSKYFHKRRVIGPHTQREHLTSIALSFPSADLLQTSCAGIIRILMCRKVKNPGVVLKAVLGAVAVMQIPVNYQYFFRLYLLIACSAPMAALLKIQKPAALSYSA